MDGTPAAAARQACGVSPSRASTTSTRRPMPCASLPRPFRQAPTSRSMPHTAHLPFLEQPAAFAADRLALPRRDLHQGRTLVRPTQARLKSSPTASSGPPVDCHRPLHARYSARVVSPFQPGERATIAAALGHQPEIRRHDVRLGQGGPCLRLRLCAGRSRNAHHRRRSRGVASRRGRSVRGSCGCTSTSPTPPHSAGSPSISICPVTSTICSA